MDGLDKYTIIPVEPHMKANLERLLQSSRPYNPLCSHPALIPGYMHKSNGSYTAQKACMQCSYRTNLRPKAGDPLRILDVCVRNNMRLYEQGATPCERCGETKGVELQHWAPQAIFNDAGYWPTSWLCVDCHRLWHRAIREAQGVYLPAEQRYSATNTSNQTAA